MRSLAACIVGFKSVWSVRGQHYRSVECFVVGAWGSRGRVQTLGHSVPTLLTKLAPGGPGGRGGPTVPHGYRSSQGWVQPGSSGGQTAVSSVRVPSVCGPPGRGYAAVAHSG